MFLLFLRRRAYLALSIVVLLVSGLIVFHATTTASADTSTSAQARSHTVGFVYVTVYKNRLVNAQVTINLMQKFFDKVDWKKETQYSFLRDVMHNQVSADDGFVNTPLGFGYGSCGGSSLLNKLVVTSKFRDTDGTEKPVFLPVLIWTWRGDKTYGKWGATIFVDPSGVHTKDYIWKLNPAYNGMPPKISTHFDMQGETVSITMQYSDNPTSASPAMAVATGNATDPADPPTGNVVPTYTDTPTPSDTPTITPTSTPTDVPPTATYTLTFTPIPTDTSTATDTPTDVPTSVPTLPPASPATSSAVKNDPASVPASASQGQQAIVKPSPDQTGKLLTANLENLIKESRFGVSVIPIGDASLIMSEVGVNQDTQAFVASAFKGPVALYFFENIDSTVWKNVPVRYWNAKSDKDVPAEFRDSWTPNKDILSDVFQAAIFSDNDSTGNVLAYVYAHSSMSQKGSNPIIAFNNWLHDSVGVSQASGLKLWWSGDTRCNNCTDDRYGKYSFTYGTKVLVPNNTFSPHDLALVYVHLAEAGRQLGYYDKAIELLSTVRSPTDPTMIQLYLRKRGFKTADKDGFVGPDSADSDGFYISTDAGLITMPDGNQFAVAFMAFDSGNLLDNAISMVGASLIPDSRVADNISSSSQ